MSPALTLVLLWFGFSVTHLALASVRVQPRLERSIGAGPFQGLYSLVALAFFVPLVWVYLENRHDGPWLWSVATGAVVLWSLYAVMAFAFVLLANAFVTPSPASVVPGEARVRGALRITRHPLVMALVLFGLVHLVFNGSTADVAFFGGFAAFGLVGAWHQDRRKLYHQTPGFAEFYASTSFLPFGRGDAWRGFGELSWIATAFGIALTIGLRLAHAPLFGN